VFLAGGRGNGPAGWWRRGRAGQLSLSLALPLSLRVFKHEHSVCTLNTDCSNCVQTVFKREHSVFTQSEQAVFKHEHSVSTLPLSLRVFKKREHSVFTLNTDCSNCVQTVFKREHSVFTVFTQSEQAVFKHEPSSATMVLNLEALPQKEDKAVESLRPRDEASLQKAHCYVQVRQALARLLP
jgi:ribosomal protein S27AE